MGYPHRKTTTLIDGLRMRHLCSNKDSKLASKYAKALSATSGYATALLTCCLPIDSRRGRVSTQPFYNPLRSLERAKGFEPSTPTLATFDGIFTRGAHLRICAPALSCGGFEGEGNCRPELPRVPW